MPVIICPGVHEVGLTQAFLASIRGAAANLPDMRQQANCDRLSSALIFPADQHPPYSAFHLLDFLQKSLQPSPPQLLPTSQIEQNGGDRISTAVQSHSTAYPALILIAFSAGVVGAIAAAHLWQLQGGTIRALIALDGWGVPLSGSFPIHRVSHDFFTHWSSALLGAGQDSFYADPACQHLELWRSPQTIQGWWVSANENGHPSAPAQTTLAHFLLALLDRYGEL